MVFLDPLITPEMFAQTICEDFDLPLEPSRSRIAEAIKERVRESENAIVPQSTAVDGQTKFTDDDVDWWKRMRKEALSLDEDADEEDRPKLVEDLMIDHPSEMPYDLRIRIQVSLRIADTVVKLLLTTCFQLDIISGEMHLVDCFEWDIQSETTPEQFAEVYSLELGLNGEFK